MGFRHFFIGMKHPYASKHRFEFLRNYLSINFKVRVFPNPVVVNWIGGAKLNVSKKEAGVIGNVYCKLYEYNEMHFLLRALKPTDLFIDVGANSGIYTILAAKLVGSKVMSFEPNNVSRMRLRANLKLNSCENFAQIFDVALSNENGEVFFYRSRDTNNSISKDNNTDDLEIVQTSKLDSFDIKSDCLIIKVDVEGFELDVLAGAKRLLSEVKNVAIIVETNNLGVLPDTGHYTLDNYLKKLGFYRYFYNGTTNNLKPAGTGDEFLTNSIYLKSPTEFLRRITESNPSLV